MSRQAVHRLVTLLVSMVLLGACGGPTPTATPTPAPPSVAPPTAAPPPPTFTPAPTAAPTVPPSPTAAATVAPTAAPPTRVIAPTTATGIGGSIGPPVRVSPTARVAPSPSPAAGAIDWLAVLRAEPRLLYETVTDRPHVTLKADDRIYGHPLIEMVVRADLDRDGRDEFVLPLYSGGTAGTVALLLFRTGSGAPRLATWLAGYKMQIEGSPGRLRVTEGLYSSYLPNCCPPGVQLTEYELRGDALVVVGKSTKGYPEAIEPTIEHYYGLIGAGKLRDAYAMHSPAYQAKLGYEAWARTYTYTRSASVVTKPAVGVANAIQVEVTLVDENPGVGNVRRFLAGTWQLVWDGALPGWRPDTPTIREIPGYFD